VTSEHAERVLVEIFFINYNFIKERKFEPKKKTMYKLSQQILCVVYIGFGSDTWSNCSLI